MPSYETNKIQVTRQTFKGFRLQLCHPSEEKWCFALWPPGGIHHHHKNNVLFQQHFSKYFPLYHFSFDSLYPLKEKNGLRVFLGLKVLVSHHEVGLVSPIKQKWKTEAQLDRQFAKAVGL